MFPQKPIHSSKLIGCLDKRVVPSRRCRNLDHSCDAPSLTNMVSLMFPDMGPGFGAILGIGGSCFVSYVDEGTVHKNYEI